jgi:uncharacterized protein YjbJ (UPF0337 family)
MTGGGTDKAKGRVKESVGALTDDDEMKREGKLDQASGTFKEKADEAGDRVDDAADKVGEKIKRG